MKMLVAIGLVAVALAMGGCGGSEGNDSTGSGLSTNPSTSTAEEKPPPTPPPEEVHKGSWAPLKRTAGGLADRLLLPKGPVPDKVLVRDLEVGDGAMVRRGDWITVAYKGFSYVTGQQTLEQWGKKSAFSWTYGLGELFYGLEPGLEGMRVGGVRELIAPSRLTHETGAMVLYVNLRKVERQ